MIVLKKCVGCTHCSSCGSPNVTRWLDFPNKLVTLKITPPGEDPPPPLSTELALCDRCVTLRERGNFCPLCNGCYEDDDYDSKMMECGRCGEWIHAHCEGLNNEHYQILSFLPDSVEYVCRTCVLEESSNWLDAVNKELIAGCEAVIQALLSSRCAKHLVKREAIKLSSSGVTSSLPCLPAFNTSAVQKKIEMPPSNAKIDSVTESSMTLLEDSYNTLSSIGESDVKVLQSERNYGSEQAAGNEDLLIFEKSFDGSNDLSATLPLRQDHSKSSETSHFSSAQMPVISENVLNLPGSSLDNFCAEGTGLPQGDVCDAGMSIPQLGGQTAEERRGVNERFCVKDVVEEDLGGDSNVCCGKDRVDLEDKETSSRPPRENTKLRLKRRRTRSSSAWTSLGPPDNSASTGIQSDSIKLRKCSVRLKDICKSRSPSLSPKFSHESDTEDKDRRDPQTLEGPPPAEDYLAVAADVLSSFPKTNSENAAVQKETEKSLKETLPGILTLKERDVSCTQVDGPNDETPTAGHVIRNLFYEDRNLALLDSTSVTDKKCDVLTYERKSCENVITNTNIKQVENQLINPKDKITKDIDDDCVSSEASSFCDTDTEIESIQEDPEEPKDLLGVKEKLKDRKYNTVLQFHVDTARVIENGRHLNRSQTRNVLATYAKHMKECFPWFDLKTMNIFELVDKRRPFPLPHLDHNYAFQTPLTGSSHLRFALRDASSIRKRSISPLKGQVVSDRRKCVLCGRESDDEPNGAGRLLYLGQDEWMHINCGLWSSEVYEEVDGGLQNVYLAVNRGRLVKCSTCQERGATVGCCHKTCQATYHFLCARRSCCQFMEDKRIFCPVHMSTANGEEKSDDFPVNRCVYVDMDSEKKKWKQVAGNRVNIVIGSLIIRNLGRIIPESDSAEALIPVEFSCSRKYWSTSDPTKKVTYTCRTKRVVPVLDESHPAGEVEIHRTIDHSMGEEAVQKEMAAVRKWFKQLEESKVEKKSRETNIIPPHLCPLYRSIKEKEIVQVAEQVMRCCTPPAMVELDVRHCIEDIIDRVSRSVEEESLLFDTDLPAIVSADDNELISMVLNDLDACDPITLHSTPSTSGRPSPLDIDFLSTCDHMMDSGKVSHSGNLTQEAQETVCNSRAMMDDVNDANTLSPDLHSALSQSGLDPQTDNLHDHIHQDTYDEQPPPDAYDIKEPIVETVAPPPAQHLGLVPLTSTLNSAEDGSASSSILESANCLNSSNSSSEGKSNSCISTNGISGSYSSSSGSSSGSSNCSSSSSSGSSSSSSSSTGNSSNSSTSGSSTGGDNSSPERCITGVISNTSSPETCCRATSENLGNTDSSNSGSDSSQSMRSNTETSSAVVSVKANSSLKQICRVLPMPSTHGRRSSSASEHSDAVGQDQSPPASRRSPCHSLEQDRTNSNGRKNDRKKICMKRNYKTVIKKYPLRSGMRKSKPYETVQIEINETIEIPRGEGSGMMRKSLKRKWSGILDTDEEDEKSLKEVGEQEGPEMTSDHGSDEDNTKENSVSKKVLKFSDDNSDITVSIVNNNNNLCDFSKSRVHKYRHKTVLQLDGAADGSSSSAEMSESQDEGIIEEVKRPGEHDDMHSPPLHSTLAMRIKEQSLARSSPGEEGPYKCGKCKRLYRTKESYQKHIETCTFEVDSSSTSDDEDEEDYDHIKTEEEEMKVVSPQPLSEKAPEMLDISKTIDSSIEDGAVESATFSQGSASSSVASQDFTTSQNISLIENIVSNLEAKSIAGNSNDMIQDYSDILGRPKPSGDEPVTKKIRIDSNLPRQPGVHRQVRTAIKKHASVSGEDIELLQVVQGVPSPGTEVFVPPPVSPVKFSPIVKKNSSPRRYSNIRLMRGGRNYQYRRAPPHMPSQDHFQGAASNIQMASATAVTAAPIQVTMQTMGNASAQILTPAAPTAAAFQPFSGQTSPYSATPQLASPVTHLSPAVQMASPVAPQVAQQVSPQVNPQAQLLTMVSAPSVAVPQGYTLQYVGSFRDGEMGAGGGSLVTYPTAPVVVPQPQLVVTPQQSSVVMPQMVNTNITYSFATPEALVINQPTMVPGMQPVQYLPQQQQQLPQQTQVIQSHSEQQVGSVMQYNQSGMSSQTASPVPTLSSHHLHSGQMHSSSCIPFSDVHSNQLCVAQHQQPQTLQPPNIVSRELSFTSHGSKPMFTNQAVNSSMNTCLAPSVSLPVSSSMGIHATTMARHRPQASVAPLPIVTTSAASDVGFQEGISHSRLPFSDRPHSAVIRTVATVAPAVITTTTVVSISTCSSSTKLTSADCSLKVATVRPRPTYSYRDAMREKQMERQKQRQELLQLDAAVHENNQADFIKGKERLENIASDSESDSENDNASRSVDKDKEDRVETQSYKLVLRKDSSTRTGFNVLPISGPDAPLPAPEVKELRIKAKVSVGPKRKKAKSRDAENDLIFANRDITQDLYVNEQLPNFSVNPMHAPAQDDPSIFEKPKSCSTEPYIVFELTSEDGFHVESRHISEVWQKVFDAVSAARASMKMDSKCASNIQDCGQGGAMSGLHMLGLTHNAVQYLLEQLPGAKDCHKYSFQFHRRPQEEGAVEENPTGCARTESFKTRSPYDIFSWLASKHRRMPERALVQQEEIQLSTTRRATSLELPMAMRYRHLRETAREAVGVFRSSIHGRGLFCKRDIDSGEMVIEYAGQVIRSSMCDMREKDYESKGIGCYMFRIDDDTVIDATMHGNAARFINHSCDPNCYSRVVDILGKKHIIIFALRRIMRGEELTYDYKFPIEDDKIPCTCGARRCRKYLN